ncbi:MAG TPA: M17 family peptidase N-terminal domain-containing protein [Nannocystaceae bacterium]|nr:M17 family peptidase N-terminal domain-containing protein [Nannocystaceae bacterium]
MTGALHELRIEPLVRALLDGVPDPDEPGARRKLDLAVVAYFEDERPLRGLGAFLDWRSCGALSRLLRTGFCSGRAGEAVLMPGRRDLPSVRVVLYGLGPRRALPAEDLRDAAATAVEMALRLQPKDVLFAMPGLADDRELAEAVLGGVVRGLGGTPPVISAMAEELEDEDAAPQDTKLRISSGPIVVAEGDEIVPVPVPVPVPDSFPFPSPSPVPDPVRWWVVADPRHVGRLRRLLDGPPRAAAS